jgi:hypothetical protein
MWFQTIITISEGIVLTLARQNLFDLIVKPVIFYVELLVAEIALRRVVRPIKFVMVIRF